MSDLQAQAAPSFSEFVQEGLTNPFDLESSHAGATGPMSTPEDPFGLASVGAHAGFAADGPAAINPSADIGIGAFPTANGDAFGFNANANVFSTGQIGSSSTTVGSMMRSTPFCDQTPINALTTMPITGELSSAGANIGMYDDGSTFSAGGGLTGVAGSVTMGDAEDSLRLGASTGPSAGFRVHHGDADGDGVMEAGLGVDFSWFSGDLKSERLGEAYNNLMAGNFMPDPIWNDEDFLAPW